MLHLREDPELTRKWTVLIVVCGFLAGLTLCLIPHFDNHHHGSEAPWTASHTAQACGISVVPCETHSDPDNLPPTLSLNTEQDTLYEGVSLRPPFPPPRV